MVYNHRLVAQMEIPSQKHTGEEAGTPQTTSGPAIPPYVKNMDNVRRWRRDVCDHLGIQFKEDMIGLFPLGFHGRHFDKLREAELLNRGFCPGCGREPIEKSFRLVGVDMCLECYQRFDPSSPGRLMAKYFGWLLLAMIGAGVVGMLRSCAR